MIRELKRVGLATLTTVGILAVLGTAAVGVNYIVAVIDGVPFVIESSPVSMGQIIILAALIAMMWGYVYVSFARMIIE